ncbi:hypothetical protein [Streptomyces corynorhini]|nr:hypothetical protein [Streptomyces corynorhini]
MSASTQRGTEELTGCRTYLAQCQICGGAYKLPWRRAAPTGEPDGTAAVG